ncbi:MAG: hypothetical protein JZD40_05580 [Sulfolobus sp.]|nr:hypothetical protein [Sulfolobus sp.]
MVRSLFILSFLFILIFFEVFYGDVIYLWNGHNAISKTNAFYAYNYKYLVNGKNNTVDGVSLSYSFYNVIDSFIIYNPTKSKETLYIIPLKYVYTNNIINYSLIITPISNNSQVPLPRGTTINDIINYGYNVTAIVTGSVKNNYLGSNSLKVSSTLFPFLVNFLPNFPVYTYQLGPNSYYDIGVSLNYTFSPSASFNATFLIAISPAPGVYYIYFWQINTTVLVSPTHKTSSTTTIQQITTPYYSMPIPVLIEELPKYS